MKFIFASDSYKGTLSSSHISRLLTEQAKRVFPDCQIVSLPVADGGEGTMEALVSARNGRYVLCPAQDPLGNVRETSFAVLDDTTAVVEMAAASGLPLVPAESRNPLLTTTYGTGQLIADALDKGFREIIIGVGGSATNDGGIGAAAALGVRFLDENGNEVPLSGIGLSQIDTIDVSGLHPAIQQANFTVMCDINNPLTGEKGATRVFGRQKGGTPEQLDQLESGMVHYAGLIRRQFGIDLSVEQGAGAAGGLSGMLMVFLNARLRSGIETVLELCRFDELLADADLVITGEGHSDIQSIYGKVVYGVGTACKKRGVPAIAIVGGMGAGSEKLLDHGITSIIPTVDDTMPLSEALARSEELYASAAYRVFRLLWAGSTLPKSKTNNTAGVEIE